MQTKTRTLKELCVVIENTITEIRKTTSPDATRDERDAIIKKVCEKYNIGEEHIRKIAEFGKLTDDDIIDEEYKN